MKNIDKEIEEIDRLIEFIDNIKFKRHDIFKRVEIGNVPIDCEVPLLEKQIWTNDVWS